jgi:hypothetical protein
LDCFAWADIIMWRKLNLLIACWGIKKAARIIDAGCLF